MFTLEELQHRLADILEGIEQEHESGAPDPNLLKVLKSNKEEVLQLISEIQDGI